MRLPVLLLGCERLHESYDVGSTTAAEIDRTMCCRVDPKTLQKKQESHLREQRGLGMPAEEGRGVAGLLQYRGFAV